MVTYDLGAQPLDALMTTLKIANADLVKASTEQLSFKVVQKARKGRRLTPNLQRKVLRAIQAACAQRTVVLGDLFNY